ncbi:dihydrofolate reductase family protein [Nocardioides sp.]|uniref:dihydrofolate reductase family protein n=1 Tax=Nocardioides sp. TaxID=35761 RepID=UPI002BCFE09E|nr:dihydrofolate reductase family protein [Nocardioides sp.]HXH79326.1 dihydrofolate reductase family protein [Nocardioides sp.]
MRTKHREWTGLVFIATSIDGYIARPDGDLDWLTDPPAEPGHVPAFEGENAPPDYDTFTSQVTHLVMGRGTYEKVLTFDQWPYTRFRVVVISTTLTPGNDDRVAVVASIDEACSILDQERAKQVYVDGGQIVTEFLNAGLIDELTISRAPVILGTGLPLFHALPTETRLIHLGTATTDSGMTSTRYRVAAR